MRYQIIPITEGYEIENGEEWFNIIPEKGQPFKIRAWDYRGIYQNEGLYEAMFNDFYQCRTHEKSISRFLEMRSEFGDTTSMRIFDYGAGCGLASETMVHYDTSFMVGMDQFQEAQQALGDRRKYYKAYYQGNLNTSDTSLLEQLKAHQFNTIFALSAVGTGDADKICMTNLVSLLPSGGWMVFNVRRETTSDQHEIIETLKHCGTIENDNSVFHRKRLDGEKIYFRILVLRKK